MYVSILILSLFSFKTVNFGEIVEAVTESSDRVKLLVHLSMNFLHRFGDCFVIWITCGKYIFAMAADHCPFYLKSYFCFTLLLMTGCSQVEILNVCTDAEDKELMMQVQAEGGLKVIRVESLSELLGVLELLQLSTGQRKLLVLLDGISLFLQGQRGLHRTSTVLFTQCLQSLSTLCGGHYAMCCWVTTCRHFSCVCTGVILKLTCVCVSHRDYVDLLNKSGQNTLSNTTSPFNICVSNNDSSSVVASAWKGAVKRVIHN